MGIVVNELTNLFDRSLALAASVFYPRQNGGERLIFATACNIAGAVELPSIGPFKCLSPKLIVAFAPNIRYGSGSQ